MGLDCSHEAFHGAYSSFSRWRNKLAEVAGYRFTKVGDPPLFDCAVLDWDGFPTYALMGEWGDRVEKDPLVYLIAHSDCDGVLHPAQAQPLADRLEELLPLLPTEGATGHLEFLGWQGVTKRFIAGLRAAVAAGEDITFG